MCGKFKYLIILMTGFIAFSLSGCSLTLHYTRPSEQVSGKKPIVLIIKDLRSQDKGRNNPSQVGVVRNTYGMPFALEVKSPLPLTTIKNMISDCLRSVGYEPIDDSQNIPQLNIGIVYFWCDGYMAYNIEMKLLMELKKSSDLPALWSEVAYSEKTTVPLVGMNEIEDGYKYVLDLIQIQIAEKLKEQKFIDAYNSISM